MAKAGSGRHVTSLIVNDLVLAAARQDRALASAVLAAGLELFPKSSALLTRRAELEVASGKQTAGNRELSRGDRRRSVQSSCGRAAAEVARRAVSYGTR
jgi:hypothetical protein